MNHILNIILLTLIPALELRASIPYGIFNDVPLALVLTLAVVTNILLGWIIYVLLIFFVDLFRRWKWFDKLFTKIVARPRKRIGKAIDKYGEIGVALFIGIPLPGSGVYTAALGAYVLGVSKKNFFIATVIGVLIAAVLVTIIMLTGSEIFSWAVKT